MDKQKLENVVNQFCIDQNQIHLIKDKYRQLITRENIPYNPVEEVAFLLGFLISKQD